MLLDRQGRRDVPSERWEKVEESQSLSLHISTQKNEVDFPVPSLYMGVFEGDFFKKS